MNRCPEHIHKKGSRANDPQRWGAGIRVHRSRGSQGTCTIHALHTLPDPTHRRDRLTAETGNVPAIISFPFEAYMPPMGKIRGNFCRYSSHHLYTLLTMPSRLLAQCSVASSRQDSAEMLGASIELGILMCLCFGRMSLRSFLTRPFFARDIRFLCSVHFTHFPSCV